MQDLNQLNSNETKSEIKLEICVVLIICGAVTAFTSFSLMCGVPQEHGKCALAMLEDDDVEGLRIQIVSEEDRHFVANHLICRNYTLKM